MIAFFMPMEMVIELYFDGLAPNDHLIDGHGNGQHALL